MKTSRLKKRVESEVIKKKTKDYVYPMDLQCYNTKLVSSDDYFQCVNALLDRFRVLVMVYEISKNQELLPQDQMKSLLSKLNSAGLNSFAKLLENNGDMTASPDDMALRKYDHASFQFLLLAICEQNNDFLLQWWFEIELKLFMLRASSLHEIGVVNFITLNNLPFTKFDRRTIGLMKKKLMMHGKDWQDLIYYKIETKTVKDLILSYKVYHHLEIACVPAELMSPILVNYYSGTLSEHLKNAEFYIREQIPINGRYLNRIFAKFKDSLDSIKYIFSDLNLGRPLADSNSVRLSKIDQIAAESFPPCMLRIHLALRKNHHLKNSSRLQYVLFLKDLGMKYEDVLKLLRDEFTKKVLPERFDKEYAYYVKHMYGMVGSRRKYHGKTCHEIAKSVVPIDDCNGCPFHEGDIEDIASIMKIAKLSESKTDEIIKFAEKSQHDVACAKFFGVTHCCKMPASIEDPVQYALKSFKMKKEIHQNYSEAVNLMKQKKVLTGEEQSASISEEGSKKPSMFQTSRHSGIPSLSTDFTSKVSASSKTKKECYEKCPEQSLEEIEFRGLETSSKHCDSLKRRYSDTERGLNKNAKNTDSERTRPVVLAESTLLSGSHPAVYIRESLKRTDNDNNESFQLISDKNFPNTKLVKKNDSENLKQLASEFWEKDYGFSISSPIIESFVCHNSLNKW